MFLTSYSHSHSHLLQLHLSPQKKPFHLSRETTYLLLLLPLLGRPPLLLGEHHTLQRPSTKTPIHFPIQKDFLGLACIFLQVSSSAGLKSSLAWEPPGHFFFLICPYLAFCVPFNVCLGFAQLWGTRGQNRIFWGPGMGSGSYCLENTCMEKNLINGWRKPLKLSLIHRHFLFYLSLKETAIFKIASPLPNIKRKQSFVPCIVCKWLSSSVFLT